MGKTIIDIANRRFGYLLAVSYNHTKKIGKSSSHYWECLCNCGKTTIVNKQKLLRGETRSCGCYKSVKAKIDSTTHGLCGHPLWCKYRDIRNRCYNQKASSYNVYGGRGVVMCDEWKNNFMSFYNWAINNGWERGLQIDKDIKGNGLLYSPETCCFVTSKVNNNNRRSNRLITSNGETRTLMQWSEKTGINNSTIFGRLRRGWSPEAALSYSTTKIGIPKWLH